MAHIDKMLEIKAKLENEWHEIKHPNIEEWESEKFKTLKESADMTAFADYKNSLITEHFDKIERADAILVCNYEKNNIPHYIGWNTLMEIAISLFAKKIIYLLHDIPELSYTDEILGSKVIPLQGDLSKMSQ